MEQNLELVYVWIDEYRNIKQQGFNLSTKFRINYDSNNDCLKIEKNKDSLAVFPEYTNIRVIVGKNGSGKTSLIEQILLILLGIETKSFLLFCNEKGDKFFSSRNINNKQVKKIDTKQLKNLFSLYFNYALDTMSPQFFDKYKDKLTLLFKPNDEINLLLVPDKNFRRVYIETIYKDLAIDYFTVKKKFNFDDDKISSLIKETFNEENFVFLPAKIQFDFNLKKYKEEILRQYEFKKHILNLKYLKKVFEHFYEWRDFDLFALKKQETEEFERKILILSLIYLCVKENGDDKFCQILNEFFKWGDIDPVEENFENDFCAPLIEMNLQDLRKLIASFNQTFDFVKAIDFFIEPQPYNEKLSKSLFENIPPFVECNMIDENGRSFLDLSFGEKLLNVLFFKILAVISENKKDTINILYDEFDIGMHPDMQRRFIDFIVKVSSFINKIGVKKINWILATHSPFILSDVPKENVIFLEKGKEENKFENADNTFGANIYDIFENGFFLDNSIGKYSEEMIKALSLVLSFEQAIHLAEREQNAFVLRNILNECYDVEKNKKLTREQKQEQDEQLLEKIKGEKIKFLKDVFEENKLNFDKYKSVFFEKEKLSENLDKYIDIVGDPIVRNHLLAIYENVKEKKNESK